MGRTYAYEIIVPRAASVALLEAIADHLCDRDARRLRAAAAEPGLLDAVLREPHESADLCLSFLFPADPLVSEFGGNPCFDDPAGGRLAVGCVWSTLRCGSDYALFTASAASSGISALFADSGAVRAVFTAIGVRAGARLVAFDDEQGPLLQVWPHHGRARVAVDSEEFDVDLWCAAAMAAFAPDG